ncbi:phage-related protein [Pseudomonas asplenii]|uniref:Phage-related protein n=1 Tax=Pseudomonas asplenii TaxID=53407 RepID=A0A0M9GBU3_9PSED|nr:phage tail protein [Pseudomonas fuscovaginae]KPA87082.1 phage-related protein [Pseudomonas fuscovaginae]
MAETFTWGPERNTTPTISFRTKSAKFGDGYEQRAADGINNRTQSWPLKFTGTKKRIEEIMDFLDRHAGHKAFYWKNPFGETVLYRCDQYQPQPMSGTTYSLTATFDQAFHP